MGWDLDKSLWRFSQHHHNGAELFGIDLPDFCQNFNNTLLMVLLFLDGMEARIFISLAKCVIFLHLLYNVLFLQAPLLKHYIIIILTKLFG